MTSAEHVAHQLRAAGITASPGHGCLLTLIEQHLRPLDVLVEQGALPSEHPLAEYARALRSVCEVLVYHQRSAIEDLEYAYHATFL